MDTPQSKVEEVIWSKACGCSLRDINDFDGILRGVEQVWCLKHSVLMPKQYRKLLEKTRKP